MEIECLQKLVRMELLDLGNSEIGDIEEYLIDTPQSLKLNVHVASHFLSH